MLLAATAVQDFDRFVARSVEAVIPARWLGHGRDVAGALNRARSRSSYPQLHGSPYVPDFFPGSGEDDFIVAVPTREGSLRREAGERRDASVAGPSWQALLGHGPPSIGSMKGDIQRAGCGRAPGCPIGLVTFTLE